MMKLLQGLQRQQAAGACIWDESTMDALFRALDANGTMLFSGGKDGTVRRWNLAPSRKVLEAGRRNPITLPASMEGLMDAS